MDETSRTRRKDDPHSYGKDTETAAARDLYRISPFTVPIGLARTVLLVKLAATRTNASLGFLGRDRAGVMERSIEDLMSKSDASLARWFHLDAYQGGAGTSIHMNVNDAIAAHARDAYSLVLDPLVDVNLHQSTNDVMPTALRLLFLDMFAQLEPLIAGLQQAAQNQESRQAGILVMGHTQLQDAIAMDAGRIFATWAGALQRDRWRIFKARERLKEVNIGGTAIGTGAGAPRSYVLGVVKELQKLTPHPVNRAEDPVEATSNYDGIAEAMAMAGIFAQTIRRIAQDIRILSSGPVSGMGLFVLPRIVKGSTIMPGKVNPVMAEAAYQVAERVMSNDALIARLCSSSELQLNAFFPLIAYAGWETLSLLAGICPGLSAYVEGIELSRDRAAEQISEGSGGSLALTPLLGYRTVEALMRRARERDTSLKAEVESAGVFDQQDLEMLFSSRIVQGLGYDETLYAEIKERSADRIRALQEIIGKTRDTEQPS